MPTRLTNQEALILCGAGAVALHVGATAPVQPYFTFLLDIAAPAHP